MSKLSKLVERLGGINTDKWKVEFDRSAVEDSALRFNLADTVSDKALTVEIDYTVDGVKHTMTAQTKFKNDGSDVIEIDGDPMDNAYIDMDLMVKPFKVILQVEFRYNNPDEVPDGTNVDGTNQKHYEPGNGNHEVRSRSKVGFSEAKIISSIFGDD